MQNKKTSPKPTADNDLPPLSVQEQALVEALGQGDDNCAAYRKAYGAEGYSPAALRVQACRKVVEPKIQAHLRALRSVGYANARLTLESRLEAELAFAQRAEDAGNYGAAGGAHDRINKLMGLYVDKLDVTVHDPLETLREIAELSSELAHQLAEQAGIDWPPRELDRAGPADSAKQSTEGHLFCRIELTAPLLLYTHS
jgi:hypothetical protein